jgi:hypothetical protein
MAATFPEVERGTRVAHHEGARPDAPDGAGQRFCCHLLGSDAEPLCGARGVGISAMDELANLRGPTCNGPHGCGEERCALCADRA